LKNFKGDLKSVQSLVTPELQGQTNPVIDVLPNGTVDNAFVTRFESSTSYIWVVRTDLTMEFHGRVSDDKKSIRCWFIIHPLFPEELETLKCYKENSKNFDKVFSYGGNSISDRKFVFQIILPDDCLPETMIRKDEDTPFGALVEITISKRQQLDPHALNPTKFSHFSVRAQTTVPLLQRSDAISQSSNPLSGKPEGNFTPLNVGDIMHNINTNNSNHLTMADFVNFFHDDNNNTTTTTNDDFALKH